MIKAEIRRSIAVDINQAILEFPEELYRERFDSKIIISPSGCHLWRGDIGTEGYGMFYIPKPDGTHFRALAHRIAWMRKHGLIPEGKQLDHLCRIRACSNEQHLEPVTRKENILRGECPPARNARKTHCEKGHALSGYNLLIKRAHGRPDARLCRECSRVNSANYHERQKRNGWGLKLENLGTQRSKS